MSEGQPTYVFVCADELAKSEGVELPAEEDGNLLLSVLQSQFEGASGLKYRQVNRVYSATFGGLLDVLMLAYRCRSGILKLVLSFSWVRWAGSPTVFGVTNFRTCCCSFDDPLPCYLSGTPLLEAGGR